MRISIFVLLFGILLHSVCLYGLDRNINKIYSGNIKLWDVAHEMNTQKITALAFVPNITIISLFIYSLYLFIKKKIELKYLSSLIFALGILFILKAITCSVTVIPPPNGYDKNIYCKEKLSLFHFINGKCGDLIFSAHTATIILFILFFIHFKKMNSYFAFIIILLNGFVITLFKEHYTIDVLMAFFVSFFIFTISFRPVC